MFSFLLRVGIHNMTCDSFHGVDLSCGDQTLINRGTNIELDWKNIFLDKVMRQIPLCFFLAEFCDLLAKTTNFAHIGFQTWSPWMLSLWSSQGFSHCGVGVSDIHQKGMWDWATGSTSMHCFFILYFSFMTVYLVQIRFIVWHQITRLTTNLNRNSITCFGNRQMFHVNNRWATSADENQYLKMVRLEFCKSFFFLI